MTAWHVLTGEYPPQVGGVADYAFLVSKGLAAEGDSVHVWCPALPAVPPEAKGVTVYPILGAVRPSNLRDLARGLEGFPRPRRLLVHWVPHAWGWRSMNVAFCEWLWRRARQGDEIDLIAHEAFLAFGEGGVKQQLAAAVHRAMVMAVLRASRRVFVTIPAWERALRPYAPRRVVFGCLPVPSNIPVVFNPAGVRDVRAAIANPGDLLAGHFGTYGTLLMKMLDPVVASFVDAGVRVLLLGRGGESARRHLVDRHGQRLASLVTAPGVLDRTMMSLHLQACDLLLQPFPDGATGRRGSLMAALAHGKPVVTTVGRLSETFWCTADGVRTVPAGDPDALAAAARHLLSNPGERERLGAAARVLYDERFDIRHTVRALRDGRAAG